MGDLHAAAAGTLARRQADHRRRCRLLVRHPEIEGRAAVCRLLAGCRQGREARRAGREVHLPRRREQRASVDHRPAHGSSQALVGDARFREDVARRPAGERRLPRRFLRARALHHDQACRGRLGQGPLAQSRPQQLRHHPLRLLSRRDRGLRGLQGRRGRLSRGIHVAELGRRLRHPGRQVGRHPARDAEAREHAADAVPGLQPAARDVQGPARARGLRPSGRLRMVQQDPVVRAADPHQQLLLQFRTGREGPAVEGRAGDPRAAAQPDPGRGLHQGVQAAGDRRQRQQPRRRAARHRAAQGGRLGNPRRQDDQQGDRPAVQL